MERSVEIFDSTLRDGAQGEGISFSVEDKLAIVQKLDELGVTFIEAGNPGSNPKDLEFFRRVNETQRKHAPPAARGSRRRMTATSGRCLPPTPRSWRCSANAGTFM